MLDAFLEERRRSTFDFRQFASPDDPLRHLFAEWVPYYRDKHAICRAIAPRSILEIGVRYGYSALAFLSACPDATYIGLDNDSDSFGGERGALAWARKQLAPYHAHIEIADTQRLDTLPGARYDLVHVDGQQDGEGTLHDLELALRQAKFILVDGIFWSRQNLDASSHFLQKYRSLIEYAVIVPGYAGDLIVRTREEAATLGAARDHRAIRDEYTREYFLQDCGGYQAFKSAGGLVLADARLVTVFEAGAPWKGLRVLDVGSGRGELAHACYRAGAEVIGLDYSSAATDIAHETYAADLGSRLQFVCEDVLDYAPPHPFDRIVATDFVEHVDRAALDVVLGRLRQWLAPSGRLLIHTWPNRLVYEWQQRKRRDAARSARIFLPRNQRSLYEDTMHLNEQTPGRLQRTLRKHFPHVTVWAGNNENPVATLGATPSREILRLQESIYAVASDTAIDVQSLRQRLLQPPLVPAQLAGLRIVAVRCPERARVGAVFEIETDVENGTPLRLASFGRNPIHLSYHWRDGDGVAVFDGLRTRLEAPLEPGEKRRVAQRVAAAHRPGRYDLEVRFLQEGVFWLDAQACEAQRVTIVE